MPGSPRRTSDGSMGTSPRCSPGEAGSRENGMQSQVPTTSRAVVPTAPSRIFMPHPSTEPQKSPIQSGLGRVPQMNPTTLTTTNEEGGCGRALVRVCSHSGLPHVPAGLNTCYSRQGKPLPRSIPQIHRKTDSLTGMQQTSGQARHTMSQGCA